MIPGALFPLLLGVLTAQPGLVGQSVTRLVVQDEVILRVPLQPRPIMPRIAWQERKGPKCIPVRALRRAMMSGPQQIDFILTGTRVRIRAELEEDCPALDFYGGLYLQPQDDRLCIRRDAIHSRMGGSCTINTFRQLIPRFVD